MQQTTQIADDEGSETSNRLLQSLDIDQAEIQRFNRFNNQSWIDLLAEYSKQPRIASVLKITLAGICGGVIFGALAGASVGLDEAKKHVAELLPRPTFGQAQHITGNMVGKTMTRMSAAWAWKMGLLAATFSSVANSTDYLTSEYKTRLLSQGNNKKVSGLWDSAFVALNYSVAGFVTSSVLVALNRDARAITKPIILGGALAGGCFGLTTSLSQYTFKMYQATFVPQKEPVQVEPQEATEHLNATSQWISQLLQQSENLETNYMEHVKKMEEIQQQKENQNMLKKQIN